MLSATSSTAQALRVFLLAHTSCYTSSFRYPGPTQYSHVWFIPESLRGEILKRGSLLSITRSEPKSAQSTPSLVVARSCWGTGVEGVHGSYESLIPPHSFGLRPTEPVDLPENSTTATPLYPRILFSHNHFLAASRPFLHPNFLLSVRILQQPFCGRLPVSRISSDPSPSSPFYLALRLINASVLGTRNQDVSPPHQLIELPALPDAAA